MPNLWLRCKGLWEAPSYVPRCSSRPHPASRQAELDPRQTSGVLLPGTRQLCSPRGARGRGRWAVPRLTCGRSLLRTLPIQRALSLGPQGRHRLPDGSKVDLLPLQTPKWLTDHCLSPRGGENVQNEIGVSVRERAPTGTHPHTATERAALQTCGLFVQGRKP